MSENVWNIAFDLRLCSLTLFIDAEEICRLFYRQTPNFAKMPSPFWNTLLIVVTFTICSSS